MEPLKIKLRDEGPRDKNDILHLSVMAKHLKDSPIKSLNFATAMRAMDQKNQKDSAAL